MDEEEHTILSQIRSCFQKYEQDAIGCYDYMSLVTKVEKTLARSSYYSKLRKENDELRAEVERLKDELLKPIIVR